MREPTIDLNLTRALDRRAFLRAAGVASAGGAALWLAGCGSSDDDVPASTPSGTAGSATSTLPSPAADSVKPVLLTGEQVAGIDNRFLVGVLDAENDFVKDAAVHLRFFQIGADGQTGTFKFETDAEYRELTTSVDDAFGEDSVPFYVATAPFDAAGRWGVEIAVTPKDGTESKVQAPFTVFDAYKTPPDGMVPPASRNDTASTNTNTESLCSRDPICGLHDIVIGDALGVRPMVIQFSTPAYCQTRFCGPVLEVLLEQVAAYRDRIDFVHIEVYRDFQLQQQRETVAEWGLPSEPFTFFVAADGTVRSRFEAIFTSGELVAALDGLLA